MHRFLMFVHHFQQLEEIRALQTNTKNPLHSAVLMVWVDSAKKLNVSTVVHLAFRMELACYGSDRFMSTFVYIYTVYCMFFFPGRFLLYFPSFDCFYLYYSCPSFKVLKTKWDSDK